MEDHGESLFAEVLPPAEAFSDDGVGLGDELVLVEEPRGQLQDRGVAAEVEQQLRDVLCVELVRLLV